MDASSLLLLLLKLTAILFQVIPGSVAQNWSVSHTPSKLCAVHHSTVVLPCKYTYPTGQTVTSSTWHYRTSKGAATERPVAHSLADGLNCSLTLDSVTQGDAGFYQFSFRTSGSTQDLTNEDGVTLEITELQVDIEPMLDMVLEGDWVTLICGSCIPSLTVPMYTWYKDGHLYKQKRGDYQLELTNMNVKDEGSYQCSISGHEDLRSSPVNITMKYPPKNVSVSMNFSGEIVEGSSVTLTCSSDANPSVEIYTWFKENESSAVGSGQSYRALQSGQYYCEAQNKHGSERSAAVSVTLKGNSVIVYVAVGLVFFGLAALLSALFWLRCKRQKKKADEGDDQNAGPSAKDDTYAALNLAGRTSDDVYHTLAIAHLSPPADTHTSSDYEKIPVGFSPLNSIAMMEKRVM
ncbi:B-cell receptor CD22-like isoform X2 [Neoarius graeffei]|uniref:B-cell receptor CD22-like isoform X2 n=1 Tax=Neoarius graeffei TaxID=443677 RepID=UPI00298C6C6D|nr:B-cell receptor CD22-like isoform X2 [Neoarius graeffei]